MKGRDDFDQALGQGLAEIAGSRKPDYLPAVLAQTRQTRQRSARLNLGRWPRVEPVVRVTDRPRTQLTMLLAAVLVLSLALAALLAIGSRPSPPSPFKPRPLGQNGLIAFAAAGDIFVVNPTGPACVAFRPTPMTSTGQCGRPTGNSSRGGGRMRRQGSTWKSSPPLGTTDRLDRVDPARTTTHDISLVAGWSIDRVRRDTGWGQPRARRRGQRQRHPTAHRHRPPGGPAGVVARRLDEHRRACPNPARQAA